MLACGCPTDRDGIWRADDYEVTAAIEYDGERIAEIPMGYAGTSNRSAASYKADPRGPLTITVTVWSAKNGSTGLDRTIEFAN